MRWKDTFGLVCVVFASTGCLSAARRSSGAIGCPSDEIVVTDESVGLLGDHTWTAECRGRTYYCSMNTAEKSAAQVTCHPAADEDEKPAAATAPAPIASAKPSPPQSEPPKKAAGFEFGRNSEQIAEQCAAAGGSFTPGDKDSRCSKPAAPVGFEGEATLSFCGSGLCAVAVTGHWSERDQKPLAELFTRLVKALYTKYGKSRELVLPSGTCREHLASCLRDGSAQMKARWEWDSGEKLTLQVETDDSGFALGLRYRVPGALTTGEIDGL